MSEISENWQRRFALIEKAGGISFPKLRTLSLWERFRARINLLAYLLGPIYYCCLGMWRKALTYVAVVFAVVILASLIGVDDRLVERVGNAVVPLFFALRANIDYYKRMVLQENGWW